MSDAVGRTRHVVVLGGDSDLAVQTVTAMVQAHPGHTAVTLCGRDLGALQTRVRDLREAGARFVHPLVFDANLDDPAVVLANAELLGGEVDCVLVAFGVLGESGDLLRPEAASASITLNAGAGARALCAGHAHLAAHGRGRLVAFSSIAAVRVRGANPVYAAGKAAFDAVAIGLGEQSRETGVEVVVARFGFVHTKMTRELRPAPFALNGTAAGALLGGELGALRVGLRIVWIPGRLKFIAGLLSVLPRAVLRRLP